MFGAAACAKLILSGEHAVVYGQPGIAFPFPELAVTTQLVRNDSDGTDIYTTLDHLALKGPLARPPEHPIALTVYQVLKALGKTDYPACRLDISDGIPMGRGLGSGTAVTTAIVRVIYQAFAQRLTPEALLEQVHQIETLYHGFPSGIDSHIICHGRPMRFQKGQDPVFLRLPVPFHFLIADTGLSAPTNQAVRGVRQRWQAQPTRYEMLFKDIGKLTLTLEQALAEGDKIKVGASMNQNQDLLAHMGVSHPRLETLIQTARQAGAYGAKLSGAGQGGVCLVLCEPEEQVTLKGALRDAGATDVYATVLGGWG